ncbi:hypothetical protein COL922a_013809, partial [Colletotrichum nupharicola]
YRMSSCASIMSPTPRSSSTSRKQAPKSLEQDLRDQKIKDDLDSKDNTKELKRQLRKTNKDFKEMRNMFNQNATTLKELQEQARKT